MLYEIFISKWNRFCYYMLASKHHLFVLSQSIEQFQKQCDDLITNIEEAKNSELDIQNLNQELDTTLSWPWNLKRFLFIDNVSKTDKHVVFADVYGAAAVVITCAIIIGISIRVSKQYANGYCKLSTIVSSKYNLITTCIILIISLIFFIKHFKKKALASNEYMLERYISRNNIMNIPHRETRERAINQIRLELNIKDVKEDESSRRFFWSELLSGVVFSLFASQKFVYWY
eukprot:289625_1